jgi:hypothetical protein
MKPSQNSLKGEMDGRLVYGSENFIEKMNMKYCIAAKKKPIGRPKKGKDNSNEPLFIEEKSLKKIQRELYING